MTLEKLKQAPPYVTRLLSGLYAFENRVLPIEKRARSNGSFSVKVAMSNPNDLSTLDDIRLRLGGPVEAVAVDDETLELALILHYGDLKNSEKKKLKGNIKNLKDQKSVSQSFGQARSEVRDMELEASQGTVIGIVNDLLMEAMNRGASDLHIEPYEKFLKARIRVDGLMHDLPAPPKELQRAMVSRIKILAQLDIAENRVPQDGRIRLRIGHREFEARVSILPSVFGESIVLRFLVSDGGKGGIQGLGVSEPQKNTLKRWIHKNHGLILMTGPTGSGKTTTLYAMLRSAKTQEKKIITIEDPVEYELDGIVQIQAKPKVKLTFSSGLRSILRHDPDVILVGEIRDEETAEIAIQASLTGHLVFSTLHTNDAAGAPARLLDMGIEPYLVASSLEGVMAQRLVRNLCLHCRKPDPAAPGQFLASSCDECLGTGYKGRSLISEQLSVTSPLRALIRQRVASELIFEQAVKDGMVPIQENGLEKIKNGITTRAEIGRVIGGWA